LEFAGVGGVYILRTLKDVEFDMKLVMGRLEKLSTMYAYLEAEKEMMLQIQAGQEAAAEIETEQLIERIKK
jgi:hypothetical protein